MAKEHVRMSRQDMSTMAPARACLFQDREEKTTLKHEVCKRSSPAWASRPAAQPSSQGRMVG